MADLTLPMFRAAALKGNPALSNSDVTNLYNANAQQLFDLDPASQLKAAMEIGASAKDATPELPSVAVTGKRIAGPTSTDTKPEETDLKVPAETVLNTQLRDPYAGTSQAAKNPTNPGASGLSQFDPDQSNAANAAYEARLRAMQPGRDVSDFATSVGSAFGPGGGSATHRDFYRDQEGIAKDLTVGQQGRLQEQATAGSALATSMQNRDIAAGKYGTEQTSAQIKQASDRADLTTKELTTAQQQRLDDPNSVETAMAKEIAKAHLSSAVPEKATALQKIIDEPGVTARQLILATGTLAPEAQKALVAATGIKQTEAGIKKTEAETLQVPEVTKKIQAETKKTEAELPSIEAQGVIDKAIAKGYTKDTGTTNSISDTPMSDTAYKKLQEAAKTDAGAAKFLDDYDAKFNKKEITPEVKALAGAKIKELQTQAQAEQDPTKKLVIAQQLVSLNNLINPPTKSTSSGPELKDDVASRMEKFGSTNRMGINIPANPANAAMAANDAAAIENANRQVEVYTQAQPAIKSLRKALAETGSGKGTDLKAKFLPGQEREVVNLMNNFNAMYPGMLGQIVGPEMAKSIDKGGFTGAAVTNMSTDQMTRFLDMVDSQVATANNIATRRMQNVQSNTPGAVAPMPAVQTQPGAAPKQAKPPTISTGEQYNALPSGATFVDARDGVTKRKP